jgi:hypothetical protein
VSEDRSAQRNDALVSRNFYGMWMRNTPAEPRPHPLDKHRIFDEISTKSAAELRSRARHAMRHIPTRRARGITSNPGPMRQLIADERSTTPAPFGIEEVHEPESNAQTRQRRSAIVQHHRVLLAWLSALSCSPTKTTQLQCHREAISLAFSFSVYSI